MKENQSFKEIRIGTLSPSSKVRQLFRERVGQAGVAAVSVESSHYSFGPAELSALRENPPEIFLIDLQDPLQGVESLKSLHAALPETWMLVSAEREDSNLIIEAMRSGAREFLPWPIETQSLSQAIQRYLAEQKDGKVATRAALFCVTAAKGGAGTTSLAVNLAASLAGMLPSVALIDLNDPIGDLGVQLNVKSHFTILDALASASRLDSVLLESYMSRSHGISVLPGPRDFRSGRTHDAKALATMLEIARKTYAHIVVDLAASAGEAQLQLMAEMADPLILVLTPELPSIWRTKRLLECFTGLSHREKLRLVLNRSQNTDEISDEDIEEVLNTPIYWELPYCNASARAINSGTPLVCMNHYKLSHQYRELACKLAGITPPKKRSRLFGSFF